MTILFDLDGTLLDTGPDFLAAVNILLAQENRAPIDYAKLRPVISFGSAKMVETAFDLNPENPEDAAYLETLVPRFIEIYRNNNFTLTKAFDGMDEVLSNLATMQIPWGIVTNKPKALTEPLLKATGYFDRAVCIVSGDTTPHSKPHPAPLHYACKILGVAPQQCLMVGDSDNDIQAGKAAGTATMAAAFGYIPTGTQIKQWQADYIVQSPAEILPKVTEWANQTR